MSSNKWSAKLRCVLHLDPLRCQCWYCTNRRNTRGIISSPIISAVNQWCANLLFLFGEQSSNDSMLCQSASVPRIDHRHTKSSSRFLNKKLAELMEFIPQTFTNEIRLSTNHGSYGKRLQYAPLFKWNPYLWNGMELEGLSHRCLQKAKRIDKRDGNLCTTRLSLPESRVIGDAKGLVHFTPSAEG